MRIIWVTDPHLNHCATSTVERFLDELAAAGGDALLVGGDIGEAPDVVERLERLRARLDIPVYFVLGNHDYYRGSIAGVRSRIRDLVRRDPGCVWLGGTDVVRLTERCGLVGHGSWADGRNGDYGGSRVELNDFHLIAELRTLDPVARLERMQVYAGEAAAHLRRVLSRALADFTHVVALVHVPPYREAARHQGRTSGEEWLPFFSCRVVGELLTEVMDAHPERHLRVLCGHTHGSGELEVRANLRVSTGGAVYGRPGIARVLELS